jgi:hypothetical protein
MWLHKSLAIEIAATKGTKSTCVDFINENPAGMDTYPMFRAFRGLISGSAVQ